VDSVSQSIYPDFEIVVVDNASTDGSIEELEKQVRQGIKAKIIRSPTNLGFGKAANLGARAALGSILVFLNDDTVVDSRWLAGPVALMSGERPFMSVRIRLASMDDPNKFAPFSTSIDLVGTADEIENQSTVNLEVLPHGAAFFIRKAFFERVGGWDEDYFLYYEDVDFCWRIRMFGGTTAYCRDSLIYHKGSASTGEFRNSWLFYLFVRNRMQSIIKNYSLANAGRALATYLIIMGAASVNQLIKGNIRVAIALGRAVLWNVKNLRLIIRKRAFIQEHRTVSDADLFSSGFIRKIDWGMLLRTRER